MILSQPCVSTRPEEPLVGAPQCTWSTTITTLSGVAHPLRIQLHRGVYIPHRVEVPGPGADHGQCIVFRPQRMFAIFSTSAWQSLASSDSSPPSQYDWRLVSTLRPQIPEFCPETHTWSLHKLHAHKTKVRLLSLPKVNLTSFLFLRFSLLCEV